MCGETKVYQMGLPMTAEALRKWPEDIQRQYLQGIVDTYAVGPKAIGQMLGYTSSGSAYMLFKRLEVKYGLRPTKESVDRFFTEFCKRDPAEVDTQPTAKVETPEMLITNLRLNLEGPFSSQAVAVALSRLIPEGHTCTISIEVAATE